MTPLLKVQYARAVPKIDDWKALLQDVTSKDAECRSFTEIFNFEDQALRHSELENALDQLNTHVDTIGRQTSELHEQNQRFKLNEQGDILNWISSVVPRHDHRRLLENSKLDSKYANAGKWLFCHPKFEKWSSRENEDASTIWLCGPVGTGKSSLVCLVIEHCLRDMQSTYTDQEQIAYFYCTKKQGEADGSHPKTILRSLIRQLAWSADNHSISKFIKDIYDESRLSHESGESRLSVKACISLLTTLISAHENTTIIIDALDECFDPLELLSNLNDISASVKSGVRLFFSSRMNVDVLEEFPVSMDAINYHGQTALHASIQYQRKDVVQVLLENGASCTKVVNDPNDEKPESDDESLPTFGLFPPGGYNALHLAVYYECEEIMRLILQKGVDINAINSKGETALHIAAQNNYAEQVRLLIEYGACIELKSGRGETAIEQAATLGYVDIVRILTDELHGDENAKWWVKVARVMRAIELGDELQVQQLLDDDENDGYRGKPPLFAKRPLVSEALQSAVIADRQKTVTIPLRKGADADKPDDHGMTPLHMAIDCRKYGLAKLLIAHGVNIEAEDQRKRRALNYAAHQADALEIMQLLLEKGADIEAEDKDGHRALHHSASLGGPKAMQLLLKHGANIEAKDRDGRRALHEAARDWDKNRTQLLLERGADIEAEDKDGWRALHFAASRNIESQVQLLLEKGANIDSEDLYGRTALDLAACQVSVEAARLLLEKGAIPRRVYRYFEHRQPLAASAQRWGDIQEMIDAWSESDSDYR